MTGWRSSLARLCTAAPSVASRSLAPLERKKRGDGTSYALLLVDLLRPEGEEGMKGRRRLDGTRLPNGFGGRY